MKTKLKAILAGTAALCLAPGAAHAQQAGATEPAPASDPSTEDQAEARTEAQAEAQAPASQPGDIIVTATRRATSLQSVPATIDVASSETLAALNIDEAAGLEQLVPGVTIARSGGVTPFIRGIGTFNAGFSEASVGVYIDGLYLPNSAGVLFSFNNISRVEVLKGPQGTLYGRNTTGGLINVITQDPAAEARVDASVGYANYDTFTQKLYATAPITDSLAANIAVFHEKQADGWSRNVFTGNETQKSEETGVYGKLQWEASPATKVTLSGLYNFSDSSKGFAFAIVPGTFGTDGTPYLGEYRISNRTDPTVRTRGYLASLRIDHEFEFADFFSLTGYQYGRQRSNLTQNGIPGRALPGQGAQNVLIDFDYNTFSQELQLNSKAGDSRFDWLIGAFYYYDDTNVGVSLTSTCEANVCAPLPGNAPPVFTDTRPTTRSISGYADGTYDITDSTHLTLGIRFTHEKKGFSGLVSPRPGFPNSVPTLPPNFVRTPEQAGIPTKLTFDEFTYRAVLTQDLASNARLYASFNRGFKSGNYNPNVVNQRPVEPEFLDAYEIGVKSELFDNRLRLNVSGFYYDYTDIQVRSNAGLPAGAPAIAQNVGAAETKGVDVQLDWRPLDGLSIAGGFEYLDAEYTDFPGTVCTAPRQPGGGFLGGSVVVPCPGPRGPNNLAGFPLVISPKYSGTLTVSYAMDTSFGRLVWTANDSYKSRFNFAPDGTVQQGPVNVIDASVSWTLPDERFDVLLFARNLTDEYRYVAGQAASTYVYVPGEPRTYGVTVGFHF